jgi:hypothetical protein
MLALERKVTMESIRDLTWVKHLHSARVVERLTLGSYRAVSLRFPGSDKTPSEQYVYRMLFFPAGGHKPVLALNLELSILGSSCLTEQAGVRHTRFDTVEETMGYDDFRRWALSRAELVLAETAPVAGLAG